jgi:UDP-2,3-diacylglucosamine pyrophosphatase LpxH
MNRKNFLRSVAIGGASVLLPWNKLSFGKTLPADDIKPGEWLNVEHSFDDYNAVIKCKSIKENIKVVHISDSHISILKDGKSELPEYTSRMDAAFKNPKHYLTGAEGNKEKYFDMILEDAKKKGAELLILTGDIVNNPTAANVEYIKKKLDECGIDYIYTAGNHDWHFEGMEGHQKDLRDEWVNKRLKPLYNGNNTACYSKIVKGVNFIMIDNSTFQVNDEHVKFFREETKKGLPIVLGMHIPVYQPLALLLPSVGTMGDPRWGAAIDKNYITERREKWAESGNEKCTYELLIEILSCRTLLAVLAGHIHIARQDRISASAYQYVTKASFTAANRFIELKG